MAKFSVPIAGHGLHRVAPNTGCFTDYARAIVSALKSLGHEVVRPTLDDPFNTKRADHGYQTDRSARPIVLGAQNMASIDDPRDEGSFLPKDAILYNSEQTGARGADPRLIFEAVKTWKHRVVWDYSEANAEMLRKMGCERVVLCPVGYDPAMVYKWDREKMQPTDVPRVPELPDEQQDIDVLFVGSIENPARIHTLKKSPIRVLDRGAIIVNLRAAGLKVHVVSAANALFGEDLDPIIGRAKIVLNLHYYEGAVFEIFRCSQLLANKKCIVTEDGGVDASLETFAKAAMVHVPRQDIVDTCVSLVKAPGERRQRAFDGYVLFKETCLAGNIENALRRS